MRNAELHFISRLSSYTLKTVFIRVSLVSATGMFLLYFTLKLLGPSELIITFKEYLKVAIVFNILSEGNVLLDNLSERYFPIPDKFKQRILAHFLLSMVIGIFSLFYFFLLSKKVVLFESPIVQLMILFGLFFIFILTIVSILLRIVEKWIYSIQEVEDLKRLKLKSDYNSLQDQLNPHFLFNNLSVLKSMITYEPDAAIVFTQNFTDVYRYVLQSREHTTVKLTDEVEFIKAYIGVHQERLGKALVNSMTINESAKYKNIPPLALQLLVENAIKHNVAIESEPLMLDIYTTEDSIVVTNNLNFKDSRHSTNRGLKNLIQRYEMLTDKKISIQSDNGFFEVKIPLL